MEQKLFQLNHHAMFAPFDHLNYYPLVIQRLWVNNGQSELDFHPDFSFKEPRHSTAIQENSVDFLSVILQGLGSLFSWVFHPLTLIMLGVLLWTLALSFPIQAHNARSVIIADRNSVDQFISWLAQPESRKMGFSPDNCQVLKQTTVIRYPSGAAGRNVVFDADGLCQTRTVIVRNTQGEFLFYMSGSADSSRPFYKRLPPSTAKALLKDKYIAPPKSVKV